MKDQNHQRILESTPLQKAANPTQSDALGNVFPHGRSRKSPFATEQVSQKKDLSPKQRQLIPYLNAITAIGAVSFVAGFGFMFKETLPVSLSNRRSNAIEQSMKPADGNPPSPQVLAKANTQLKLEHALVESHQLPLGLGTAGMYAGLFSGVGAALAKDIIKDR